MLKSTIEVDETYIDGKGRRFDKLGNKKCVVSLVERGGNARSFVLNRITGHNLKSAIMEHVQDGSIVCPDDYFGYRPMLKIFTSQSSQTFCG